jgi:phage terminase large subunit
MKTINLPLNIDLSDPRHFNDVHLPLLFSDKRRRVIYGSRDSGKSDFVAQAHIIQALQSKFFRGLLVRKYYASIKSSQFQTILDYINYWDLKPYFKITENPLKITCKFNDNSISAVGLDKPDKSIGLKDPTSAWYEEADQISLDAYLYTSRSLRSSFTNEIVEWFTFNPRNEHSWLNSYFFPPKQTYEREDGEFTDVPSIRDDTVILHTFYKHNRFCPYMRRKELEDLKNIDLNYYRVHALGLWGGSQKGLIYPEFTIIDDFPADIDYAYGLDYGYNNPTALVKVGFHNGEIYLQEKLYNPSYTHTTLTQHILKYYGDEITKNIIVVDSAEPALIKHLRSYNINAIPALKNSQAIKTVYDGLMFCKQFKINVVKGSDNLLKEIQSYSWKSDKDGNIYDEPVKIDDHAMDAWRYVVQTYGIKHWRIVPINHTLTIKNKKRNQLKGY